MCCILRSRPFFHPRFHPSAALPPLCRQFPERRSGMTPSTPQSVGPTPGPRPSKAPPHRIRRPLGRGSGFFSRSVTPGGGGVAGSGCLALLREMGVIPWGVGVNGYTGHDPSLFPSGGFIRSAFPRIFCFPGIFRQYRISRWFPHFPHNLRRIFHFC